MNIPTVNGFMDNEDSEYPSKCTEYLMYIDNHKKNVIRMYNQYFRDKLSYLFPEFDSEVNDVIRKIMDQRIELHDNSKYGDSEFYAYRKRFYPTTKENIRTSEDEHYKLSCDEAFKEAWKHHQENNSHHIGFYHLNEVKVGRFQVLEYHPLKNYNENNVDMALCDVIEMLCDWMAMSIDDNWCYIRWYTSVESKDEREALSYNTKYLVETLTSKLFPDEYNLSNSPIWILKNKE